MEIKDYSESTELMPKKGKISKKTQGKRNWNVKDVQAEEIRYKRKVKYQSYQFDEDLSETNYENEGWV